MQRYQVRISDGNTLLLLLCLVALADTAALVVAIELKLSADLTVLLGGFFTLLVLETVTLFQVLSLRSEITVDDAGVRRTTAGRPPWFQPWSNLKKVLWLDLSAGHVLEIDLHQGDSVKWTQSSWMRGHAQFGECAAEIQRRVG